MNFSNIRSGLLSVILLTTALVSFSQPCVILYDTTSMPTYPSSGTIEGCETYEFCYNLTQWNMAGSNWFHGIALSFGPGWDLATLTPTTFPGSCDGNGVWDFYLSCTGSASGITFGPGFYYDSPSGGPLDGNPGNNFGDNCTFSTSWNMCFSITTLCGAACIDGADLWVSIEPVSDGEAGSWGNPSCYTEPPVGWSGPTLECCDSIVVEGFDPLCFGDPSGSIMGVGGVLSSPFSFTLSTGANITSPDTAIFTGLPAGAYELTTIDATGCVITDSVYLVDPPEIVISLDNQINVACPGGSDASVDVSAVGGTGPIEFQIDGGPLQASGTFSGLAVGTYTISAVDSVGCVVDFPIDIIEDNLLSIAPDVTVDVSCFEGSDGSISVFASGGYPPYQYSLDNATWQASATFTGLTADLYTVYLLDDNGCVVSVDINVDEPVLLEVDAGEYLPLSSGGSVELLPSSNATVVTTWTWMPPTGLSCTNCENPIASPEVTTWYTVTIIDDAGCVALDSTQIIVVLDLVIPNAFTPNGDGLNDFFGISSPFIDQYAMVVYDRWGEIVFQTNDKNVGWDGTFKGKDLEMGTYIYVLQATTVENKPIDQTGTITLIR